MDAADILMEARAYLEKDWCQGALSRRELIEGRFTSVAWCPMGAIVEAHQEPGPALTQALQLLRRVMGLRVGDGIADWNDRPGRTKEEVLEAFDRAIALGVEEETR